MIGVGPRDPQLQHELCEGDMFSKILIPTDGSDLSLDVLWTLRPLLVPKGRAAPEVVLLRVVPTHAEESAADAAEAELAETHRRLTEWGFKASVALDRGDPAEQVLSAATDMPFDLVAMASHGRSGLVRVVRGSVAERVLRRCPVPLLLCTPRTHSLSDQHGFQRILVPLDGSELADEVLPDVERIALASEAEVMLLRVEGLLRQPPLRFENPDWWSDDRVEELLAPLNPQRERLQGAGVRVRRQVAYGSPADQILRAAERADLIAMTTHGRSGRSRWIYGSVAETVLREAGCPLLVKRTLVP